MTKWLLSLLGGAPLSVIGFLALLVGAAIVGAYVTGRTDASALCNAAALASENAQLRKDVDAMRAVSAAAVERATTDAAAISLLRSSVEELEHAFSTADTSCRLTPDDARRLRAIR